MSEISEVVESAVREVLETPDGPDPLLDRRWDSLLLEQVIAEIEERLFILLTPEDVARPSFADLPTLVGVIERRYQEWAQEESAPSS